MNFEAKAGFPQAVTALEIQVRNDNFSGLGKSGSFVIGQGNSERT